jgi:hypothetical protein
MSQENVEIVRAAMSAFNSNDLDAALEAVHPEVRWQSLDVLPDSGTYLGHEGVRRFWELWHDSFRGLEIHLEACAPLGERHVIATTRLSGEGLGSGVDVQSVPFFQLFEFSADQVVRCSMFGSEAEALEAVGLSE